MRPVTQQHYLGCGAACLAFILKIDYQDVIKALGADEHKLGNKGLLCKELVGFLNSQGFDYRWKYVNRKIRKVIYNHGVIVFIKRSKRYPPGHFLVRYKDRWMDPWINWSKIDRQSGFRKRLPGRPIYAILPK